jgi:hypothetical protein
VRPQTAVNGTHNVVDTSIQEEINALRVEMQDRDVEIERLKTTCFTLSNRANLYDDLLREN